MPRAPTPNQRSSKQNLKKSRRSPDEINNVSNAATFSSPKTIPKFVRGATKDYSEAFPLSEDHPYHVTLSVTIAIAYPRLSEEQRKHYQDLICKQRKTVEAPRSIHQLHCSYTAAPKLEPTQLDVITYPYAAKIFTEHDWRLVQTWDDGENLWVAWVHTHDLKVSIKNVASLRDHVINVTFWDYKEKLSQRARADRPKAFRLPSPGVARVPVNGLSVDGMVQKQSISWGRSRPRNSIVDPGDIQKVHKRSARKHTSDTKNSESRASSVQTRKSSSRQSTSVDVDKKQAHDSKVHQVKLQNPVPASDKESSVRSVENAKPRRKRERRKSCESEISKGSCVSVEVRMENLFAGIKSTTSRLTDKSGSLVDGYVTMAVDGEVFLSPALEKALNPLSITIKSVKHLPDTPVPQETLKRFCQPVYCKYNFLNQSEHVTFGRPRGKHVYFKDTHVVFFGLLNEAAVRQYVQSNSFFIEVHDRDKLEYYEFEELSFSTDTDTDNTATISEKSISESKKISHSALKSAIYNPFGLAKIPLLDLLRGSTVLCMDVAVIPGPKPLEKKGSDHLAIDLPGSVDRPDLPPQLPGHYIESSTTLKITIRLRFPFVPPNSAVKRLLPLPQQMGVFSRVVYYFSHKNWGFFHTVREVVTDVNAMALGVDHFDPYLIDAILCTVKLSSEQKESKTLDIITGFHIMDDNLHLLVLEGLREGAMNKLHVMVDRNKNSGECRTPTSHKWNGGFLVHLYDSSLTFNHRLYSDLDVDLCRIRLCQTINNILNEPLLYISDIVPHDCLQCLIKCQQITQAKRLCDAVYSNLLPTPAMLVSMSGEFGIPLSYTDFEDFHASKQTITEEDTPDEKQPSCEPRIPSRRASVTTKVTFHDIEDKIQAPATVLPPISKPFVLKDNSSKFNAVYDKYLQQNLLRYSNLSRKWIKQGPTLSDKGSDYFKEISKNYALVRQLNPSMPPLSMVINPNIGKAKRSSKTKAISVIGQSDECVTISARKHKRKFENKDEKHSYCKRKHDHADIRLRESDFEKSHPVPLPSIQSAV